MHPLKTITLLIILTTVLFNVKENNFSQALLDTENWDDAIIYAKSLEKLGEPSLPIFIETIRSLMIEPHHLNNYGKVNICLNSLYRLAHKGISSKDEAILLLDIIERQIYIGDTLITANILNLITGINVGYDQEFVENYTESDEEKRIRMIREWEVAIRKKWRGCLWQSNRSGNVTS